MTKKIVFLSSHSARYEPVIKKKANTAVSSGIETAVIYWDRKDEDVDEFYEDTIRYIPLRTGKTSFGRGIYNIHKRINISIKMFLGILKLKPHVIHASDLDTVIYAIVYKFLFN